MNTNNTTINAVLRAATPTTFAEYQKWLKQWREVYARETQTTRNYRKARRNFRDAGGFGRLPHNIKFAMTPWVAETFDRGESSSRYQREQLCHIRVLWKPLGKELWEANKPTPVAA